MSKVAIGIAVIATLIVGSTAGAIVLNSGSNNNSSDEGIDYDLEYVYGLMEVNAIEKSSGNYTSPSDGKIIVKASIGVKSHSDSMYISGSDFKLIDSSQEYSNKYSGKSLSLSKNDSGKIDVFFEIPAKHGKLSISCDKTNVKCNTTSPVVELDKVMEVENSVVWNYQISKTINSFSTTYGYTTVAGSGKTFVIADVVEMNKNRSDGHTPSYNHFKLKCTNNTSYSASYQTSSYSTESSGLSNIALGVGASKTYPVLFEIPTNSTVDYVYYDTSSLYSYTVGYDPTLALEDRSGNAGMVTVDASADVTYNFSIGEYSQRVGSTYSVNADNGYRFVTVQIVSKNNSYDDGYSPSGSKMKLVGSDGNTYDYHVVGTTYSGGTDNLSNTTLGIGASQTYSLVFQIPISTTGSYVVHSNTYGYTTGYDPNLPFENQNGNTGPLSENRNANVTYNFSIGEFSQRVGSTFSVNADDDFKFVTVRIVSKNNSYSDGYMPSGSKMKLVGSNGNTYDYHIVGTTYNGGADNISNTTLGAGSSITYSLVYQIPSSVTASYIVHSTTYGYTVGYDSTLSFDNQNGSINSITENRNANVTYNYNIGEYSQRVGSKFSVNADDNFKFVTVQIVSKNNSYADGYSPSGSKMTLVGSNGNTYDYHIVGTTYNGGIDNLSNTTLGIGSAIVYTLVYQIPSDIDGLYVTHSTTYGYSAGYDSTLNFVVQNGSPGTISENRDADVTYDFKTLSYVQTVGSQLTANADNNFKFVKVQITCKNNSEVDGYSPSGSKMKLMGSNGNIYDYHIVGTTYNGGANNLSNTTLGIGSSISYTLVYQIPSTATASYIIHSTTYGYTAGYDSTMIA